MGDLKKRSVAKIVTWHLVAICISFSVSYFFTGQVIASAKITFSSIVIGMTLFYFHERIWDRIKWGRF